MADVGIKFVCGSCACASVCKYAKKVMDETNELEEYFRRIIKLSKWPECLTNITIECRHFVPDKENEE
jgi:hypothetical protein